MVRVGLVGCGTIGSGVAAALERRYARHARLVALHDSDPARAHRLRRRLRSHPPLLPLPALIRTSQLVIEAASAGIAPEVAARALRAGRTVLIMSVGGLLRDARWRALADRGRGRLIVPSGALAGLDGVAALAAGRLRRVTLTTSKPPRALAGAPALRGRRLARLTRPMRLFEGSPRAVVAAFTQNTNIAAALSLACGRAARRIRVRVVADPRLARNVHELDAEGDAGRVRCRIESRPSANPKTSELAVRSAIATVARLFDPIVIGT